MLLPDAQPDSPEQPLEDRAVESLWRGGANSRFLNPKHNVFRSCDANHNTYMGRDGYVNWPACENEGVRCITNANIKHEPWGANNMQIPGTKYRFPDGRCFKAREGDWCNGCLNEVHNHGSNTSHYDRYDSCEAGPDTRYQDHVTVGAFDANNPAYAKFSVNGQPWVRVFHADPNHPILNHGGVCDKNCHKGSAGDARFEIFKLTNNGPWAARWLGPDTNDLYTKGAAVNWGHNLRIAGPMRKCLTAFMSESLVSGMLPDEIPNKRYVHLPPC